MAGLIKDEDIQLVRERARIDEVVEQYVTLRNAGGGSRKGLCPFHDEKSPSFNVRPAQGYYHCFGCGVGGDSIKFLMEIEGLTFVESVERLASKYGIQLRYEEGTPSGPRRDPRQRQRLLEAHRLAGEFYASALTSPDAEPGRTVHHRPRLRPVGGRDVRHGLGATRGRGPGLAPQGERLHRRGAHRRRARLTWPARPVRPVPRPPAVAHSRDDRRDHRVRRPADVRRRQGRGQVPQHVRDADLQEEPGAVRPRPRPQAHLVVQPGRRRRGIHRRHGLPPGRRAHSRRHQRHRVRRGARTHPAPGAARPRRLPRRGRVHVRRRRGRPAGRHEGVRRRPAVRRADLRRGRAARHGSVRPPARRR